MKAKNIYLSAIMCFGLLFTGCNNFDNLNENPNEGDPATYNFDRGKINTSLRNGACYWDADVQQRIKALGIDVWAQYTMGNATRNYTQNDGYLALYWTQYYSSWLAELNLVIKNAEGNNQVNFVALCKIWRVYIHSMFTDVYGPAPLPKSPTDKDLQYESLDKQYEFFFNELEESVALFDSTQDFLSVHDQIYWGNMDKWKRFANTLRLRLALKLSEIAPEICKAQAQAAVDADNGILKMGDDAGLGVTSGWGKQYPYYMYQITWSERQLMMKSMEKILTGIGGIKYTGKATEYPSVVDPRGERYFDPSPTGKWGGIEAGLQSVTDQMQNDISAMSTTYVIPDNSRKTYIMLYSEACFLMAEATERGFISGLGTARGWYEAGVRESFRFWNLSDNLATEYLGSAAKNTYGTSPNYDDYEDFSSGTGNTRLEKIITQKYISHYIDMSMQSWNDKRRLNLPAMDIPSFRDSGSGTYPNDGDIKNPANYISRMTYPQNEKSLNNKNYSGGVSQLSDGDKTSSPLWWASKRANYCTSVITK